MRLRDSHRLTTSFAFTSIALTAITLLATSAHSVLAQSGTWKFTGSLNTARTSHTATLLPSGLVLVAGGEDAFSNPLASAELYNPATGTWAVTGSMVEARIGHTATLLQNGEVLVAGGSSASGTCSSSAELYNPSKGRWTPTGSMTENRCSHAATLLPGGLVLVAGGCCGTTFYSSSLFSAELYNPSTGMWKATGSLNDSRSGAAMVVLQDGQALIAGGDNLNNGYPTPLASTELYDPSKATWTLAQSLNSATVTPTTTLLASGDVLVVGGFSEFSDPLIHVWTNTGSYPKIALVGGGHAATLLDTGKVLVTGTRCNYSGCSHVANAATFLYDFSVNLWSTTGSLNHARVNHTATLLPNGQVLVVGGQFGIYLNVLASAELYTP